MSRPKTPIPAEFLALSARLAEWRNSHPPRSPLPEDLWQEATTLAAQHGVHRTARALPVDYTHLNKRVNGLKSPAIRRMPPPAALAAFVDLMPPPQPQQGLGVVVELLRIQAHGTLDWTQLLTAWQQQQPKP